MEGESSFCVLLFGACLGVSGFGLGSRLGAYNEHRASARLVVDLLSMLSAEVASLIVGALACFLSLGFGVSGFTV